MRIFKDLNMVEYLGSGIPRIFQGYGKECFRFTDIFAYDNAQCCGQKH